MRGWHSPGHLPRDSHDAGRSRPRLHPRTVSPRKLKPAASPTRSLRPSGKPPRFGRYGEFANRDNAFSRFIPSPFFSVLAAAQPPLGPCVC